MFEKILRDINLTYIFILTTTSFVQFLTQDNTAYEWPAIDMFPFFERHFDASFLRSDFYTSAVTSEPNPRWVFGYFVIGLAELFYIDWYVVVYLIKVVLILFLPVMYYLIVYLSIAKFVNFKRRKDIQILILISVLIAMYQNISSLFSIAGWSPYFVQATPQSVSLFIGFIAIILSEISSKNTTTIFFVYVLFAISTFIHPAISLFVMLFYFIINYIDLIGEHRKYIKIFLLGFVLPALVIKVALSTTSINTLDFIDIYVMDRHPHHYHLIDFVSSSPLSWTYHFIAILILLLIPVFYFFQYNNKKKLLLASLCLLSYVLAIFLQYVFIDLYPSKLIASIGPVRFSQFSYWMLAILWIIMLSDLQFLHKLNFTFSFKRKHLGFWLVAMITTSLFAIDYPIKTLYNSNRYIYGFIESTDANSVFAVYPGDLSVDIPNVARRAIFIGNYFPFNESYFKEYIDRKFLLFGSKLVSRESHYRSLSPRDFINISKQYRLDYVIIEPEYSSKFREYSPIFFDNKLVIYKVADFIQGKK